MPMLRASKKFEAVGERSLLVEAQGKPNVDDREVIMRT